MKLNNKINTIDLDQDPFVHLWLINCVLFAVVATFLIVKGWTRKYTSQTGKGKVEDKQKEMYERQAGEIRKNISIAKAEIERIKSNRKITTKGRRNQGKLLESCKVILVAALVNYMEREKSKLRKLKKGFVRRKKLYEARQVNRKFQQDPGSVYSCFGKMLEKQQENEKPRYDRTLLQGQQDERRKFEDIEEASEFWKALWEGTGSGNAGMEWLGKLERQ